MFSNRKIGGIRFIRVGQLQLSYCITKRQRSAIASIDGEAFVSLGIMAVLTLSLFMA